MYIISVLLLKDTPYEGVMRVQYHKNPDVVIVALEPTLITLMPVVRNWRTLIPIHNTAISMVIHHIRKHAQDNNAVISCSV